MNTAQQNGLVVTRISSEREFNGLVVYGSQEEILQEKASYETTLQALTSGTVRTMGHIAEAMRSRLTILNTTLARMF